jgi:hypothetical protein
MLNSQLKLPLVVVVLFVAVSWNQPVLAADPETPSTASTATVSETASITTSPSNMPFALSAAPKAAVVEQAEQTAAAAPKIAAPGAPGRSRIGAAPRRAPFEQAWDYNGRPTRCSTSPACAGNLILGIGF